MVEQFKQFTNDDTDLLVRARSKLLSCDRVVLVACTAVALLAVTVLALSITLGLKNQRPDLMEVRFDLPPTRSDKTGGFVDRHSFVVYRTCVVHLLGIVNEVKTFSKLGT